MIPQCEENIKIKNDIENKEDAIEDTGWQNLNLLNNWVNYGNYFDNAQSRKIGKQVLLRGLIKSGNLNVACAQLVQALRPQNAKIFLCKTDSSYVEVRIDAEGLVIIKQADGAQTWTSLAGISFFVD